jgi:hypothetical protein
MISVKSIKKGGMSFRFHHEYRKGSGRETAITVGDNSEWEIKHIIRFMLIVLCSFCVLLILRHWYNDHKGASE